MDRFKFCIEKIKFLVAFIWWREWELVKEEWNRTYKDSLDSKARWPEIEKEAIDRLYQAILDHDRLKE